jgi:hypothetical protein
MVSSVLLPLPVTSSEPAVVQQASLSRHHRIRSANLKISQAQALVRFLRYRTA